MRLPPTSASPGPVSSTGLAEFQDADLEASIPARFATLVAQLPAEHLAYHGADAELTYRQLDRLSDAWAAKLVALLGRGRPGAQAAIITLLPHGGLSLIGLLAVLKAGHFYVPLEINQGDDYAARIIADCAPQATLTTGELLAQAQRWMSVAEPASLLTIDAEPPTLEPGFVSADSFSQMIASVLYTSGSTGWPRGVIRTHRQNLFSAYVNAREGGYNPEARVAHLISYAFSFSVPVIFGALLTGATLVGPPAMSMLPSELYGWLRAHEISVFQCAPSVLRELSAVAGDFPPLTSLTAIATGMEPVSREVIQRLSRLLPAGCLLMFRLRPQKLASSHTSACMWVTHGKATGHPPVIRQFTLKFSLGMMPDSLSRVVNRVRFACVVVSSAPVIGTCPMKLPPVFCPTLMAATGASSLPAIGGGWMRMACSTTWGVWISWSRCVATGLSRR